MLKEIVQGFYLGLYEIIVNRRRIAYHRWRSAAAVMVQEAGKDKGFRYKERTTLFILSSDNLFQLETEVVMSLFPKPPASFNTNSDFTSQNMGVVSFPSWGVFKG